MRVDTKVHLEIIYDGEQCHANCPGLSKGDDGFRDRGFCKYFDNEVGFWPGYRLSECVDAEADE